MEAGSLEGPWVFLGYTRDLSAECRPGGRSTHWIPANKDLGLWMRVHRRRSV
jgi:hypothetical protein